MDTTTAPRDRVQTIVGTILALALIAMVAYAVHGARTGTLPADRAGHYDGPPPRFELTTAEVITARDELASLTIAEPSTTTDTYDREAQFGRAWDDNSPDPQAVAMAGNSCDTRDDILARDLINPTLDGACTVTSGVLWDPYTATTIAFTRGKKTSSQVQIDHIVALGDAWISGGDHLTQQDRVNIANDPINLVAVDGPTNGAKGARNAAEWMPPNESIHCFYAASQVQVKAKYQLTITQAEHDALAEAINTCPNGV